MPLSRRNEHNSHPNPGVQPVSLDVSTLDLVQQVDSSLVNDKSSGIMRCGLQTAGCCLGDSDMF